ncbi:unnamed protein product [Rotaria sp. Silwood2]|nr:unnamed protein product [Rotaria sp. Silwood2]CAF3083152.1 unnamed protein product [Rotaria sp. Silwood2]CAF3370505.1 unnamed protein product [Rotaria sp. Silwood2]CAF4264245.1 unnamed protein product [Rotaria sp. Silwood2]CAF4269312.1 unnamed protein product [Rotaria sp. Silwood2]
MLDYLFLSSIDQAEGDLNGEVSENSNTTATETNISYSNVFPLYSIATMVTTRCRARQLSHTGNYITFRPTDDDSNPTHPQSTSFIPAVFVDDSRIEYTDELNKLKEAQHRDADLQHSRRPYKS